MALNNKLLKNIIFDYWPDDNDKNPGRKKGFKNRFLLLNSKEISVFDIFINI